MTATFVDTNVFVYAVGRAHPLQEEARKFFAEAARETKPLVTSAEVLQELLHLYLPVGRIATLDKSFDLVRKAISEVWEMTAEDAYLARSLAARHSHLGARDLIHLASCRRREVSRIKTYDRTLAATFEPAGG